MEKASNFMSKRGNEVSNLKLERLLPMYKFVSKPDLIIS